MNDSKIYDCFLFFNELEILEIRLHELYDHVDYFVLVESAETFRGQPKPYYFQENRDRFAPFLDKIIAIRVPDAFIASSPWDREAFQRNQIMRGLKASRESDVILVSDVDEIPKKTEIAGMAQFLNEGGNRTVALSQALYRFYLNIRSIKPWIGTCGALFKDLKMRSPQWLRDFGRKENPSKVIPNGGWHFTSMGGEARTLQKFASFSHTEFDGPHFQSLQVLMDVLCEECYLLGVDETLPQYVWENQDRMKEWEFILP